MITRVRINHPRKWDKNLLCYSCRCAKSNKKDIAITKQIGLILHLEVYQNKN